MLVFIDESGIPHPCDPNPTWAIAAVCFPKEISRRVAGTIYGLKMKFYGRPSNPSGPPVEIKAHRMLTRYRYHQAAKGHTKALRGANLVEAVFGVIQSFPEISIYAVTGERPTIPLMPSPGLLPLHYLFLLQRIYRHARELGENSLAIIIFDEKDPTVDAQLSHAFTHFLFNIPEGQDMKNLQETAFFVSSEITPGVQLADLVASCLRYAHEMKTTKESEGFTADPFVSAIKRYNTILEGKTKDFKDPYLGLLWGIYHMPAKYFLSGVRPMERIAESKDDFGEK